MKPILNTSHLHYAGAWQPISNAQLALHNSYPLIVHAYGNFRTASDSGESVALSGWNGLTAGDRVQSISTAVLQYQIDGHLQIDNRFFGWADQNNGSWGPVIADFNRDGIDDILFISHNESPGELRNSTAYLSYGAANYRKVILNDSVQAHQAELVHIDGEPMVLAATLGQGLWLYEYNQGNGEFDFIQINVNSLANGSAGTIADLTGEGDYHLISGGYIDFADYQDYPGPLPESIGVFTLDHTGYASPAPVVQYQTYFHDDPLVAPDIPNRVLGTLTPRMWIDDFNQDSLPDAVSLSGIYGPWQKSVIQLHQNVGNSQFVDVTDQLNPDFNRLANPDYNLQIIDIDNSGIASYLAGAASYGNHLDENGNYLLLNDGTGRLHVALHDEFLVWSQTIKSYLSKQVDVTYVNGLDDPNIMPNFRGYLTDDGKVNYLATIEGSVQVDQPNLSATRFLYVSLNTRIDVSEQFTREIVIDDRNGSSNIRTFAGNDSIGDTAAATTTRIDGGLGLDTMTYTTHASDAQIQVIDNGQFVVSRTEGQTTWQDTLINIERLTFADISVALDIDSNSGQAYRLYKAAFDRAAEPSGLGFWINALDSGAILSEVAAGFIHSQEFQTRYGVNPTQSDLVRLLYENVLDRQPDAQGYEFWLGAMGRGLTTPQLLVEFSESIENKANVAELIAHGVEYLPYHF
jgi:hypothetical protein